MNDLFSLAGKNILITGAAQGIGYLLEASRIFFLPSIKLWSAAHTSELVATNPPVHLLGGVDYFDETH